jgi:hypothetical protein
MQLGQCQIGSSGRAVAAYPVQPRTLRIMDQRGGRVCLTSPSIQYR